MRWWFAGLVIPLLWIGSAHAAGGFRHWPNYESFSHVATEYYGRPQYARLVCEQNKKNCRKRGAKGMMTLNLDQLMVQPKALRPYTNEIKELVGLRYPVSDRAGRLARAKRIHEVVAKLKQKIQQHRPYNVPNATLRQFSNAAKVYERLAAGGRDRGGKDSDMFGQHMALGFTYLYLWSKE